MLRIAGIPVSDHETAVSADHAAAIAARLQYPVVVKPANLDGGRGVAAGLINEEEVRKAFDACLALSSAVLVEKHFEGRDYRIIVLHDQAIFAVERVPGGVVGNGRDTIEHLLSEHNSSHYRSGVHAMLGQLKLDDEARLLLGRQQLNLDSIPEAGQVVRLRRAASVASGGTPVAVFDEAHPDNLDLAVRAAQALRLDLAGIDLLIPDIARSWRETGAAVCEVNARPNVGRLTTAHLYGEIIDTIIDGDGRIPIVLIVGAENPAALAGEVERHFAGLGLVVGCHDAHEVRVAGIPIDSGNTAAFKAGQVMAVDPRVQLMILSITDTSLLRTGLPLDRFDIMILAGSHLGQDDKGAPINAARFVESLLPACDKAVIPLEGCGSAFSEINPDRRSNWHPPVRAGDVTSRLAEIVLPAEGG
jgi:cyanophycin synthetase